MKRAIDVAVGSALLILALPVVIVIAIVAAIELRAWPFFSQDRIGRNGQLFRFIKLRTLPASVPPYADKYQLEGVALHRFCAFLRGHHLDELPQLYLVLIGRMSLVGPRPEMPQLHDMLDSAFAHERTTVRPGCTGLWQIGPHCMGLIGESPEYDRCYVRNASLRLDGWIMARTIRNFLPGGRPTHLYEIPSSLRTHAPTPSVDIRHAVETADV